MTINGSTATYTPPAGVSNETDYYVYFITDDSGNVGAVVITVEYRRSRALSKRKIQSVGDRRHKAGRCHPNAAGRNSWKGKLSFGRKFDADFTTHTLRTGIGAAQMIA